MIGNSAYRHAAQLQNPKNDAADISAVLTRLGFKVITALDLDKQGMDRAIRDFAGALPGAEVGVLFYAGHGLQVGGNYLVPIDAELTTAAALDFELDRLDLLQRTMEREAATNVLFLDACRDNPLSRNLARSMGTRSAEIGRGLAATELGVGTLISFSTQPGNVALDGSGRNSPYASALLKLIAKPGEDLSVDAHRRAQRGDGGDAQQAGTLGAFRIAGPGALCCSVAAPADATANRAGARERQGADTAERR